MKSAFECTPLETVKRTLNADSSKKIAAFYEPFLIQEFLISTTEEIREKIFSISNPSLFFEILNPLIELNSLYMTEKMPDTPIWLYKYSEKKDCDRMTIVSMQSLIMLCEVIDDPELQSLLSCFVFLEKKVTPKSTFQSLNQPCFDSKNVIADAKKFFQNYDKVLKVMNHCYLQVFEIYQNLLSNFAKGFKHICKKQKEEEFFFEVANYFLSTFPREVTIEEMFINRIYSNVLAFGYILENRILRAFEKSKMLIKLKEVSPDEGVKKKKTEPCNNIHIGKLSFMVAGDSFELNQYEDFSELKGDCDLLESPELINEPEEHEIGDRGTLNIRKSVSDTNTLHIKKNTSDTPQYLKKPSDNMSVISASTSESSVDSECLKAKRRHRKRRRRPRRKNWKQTPEDYLRHPTEQNFQNWVYGNGLW